MYPKTLPNWLPADPCSRVAGEQCLVAGRMVVLMVFVVVLLRNGVAPVAGVGIASTLALLAARTRPLLGASPEASRRLAW